MKNMWVILIVVGVVLLLLLPVVASRFKGQTGRLPSILPDVLVLLSLL